MHRDTIDQILLAHDNEISTLQSLMKQKHQKGRARSFLSETMLENMECRIQQVEALKKLQDWLASEDLIAGEVPTDGNCGVWSILSLQKNEPLLSTSKMSEEAHSLRLEISTSWRELASNRAWQQFYVQLFSIWDKDGDEDEDSPAERPCKAEKQEPQSPRKLKKLKGCIDLITPPKSSSAPKRLVVADGDKPQSVYPSKRPLPNPTVSSEPCGEASADPECQQKKKKRSKNLKESVADLLESINQEWIEEKEKMSKRKSKEDENQKEQEEAATPAPKKRRRRLCKVKQKTDEDRKLAAAKTYLGTLGITWQFSQSYHCRFSNVRCGEFTLLQRKLINGEEPHCSACQAMLKIKSFVAEDLQVLIKSALEEHLSPAIEKVKSMGQRVPDEQQHQAETLPVSHDVEPQPGMLAIMDKDAEEGDEAQPETEEGNEEQDENGGIEAAIEVLWLLF